MIIIPEPPRPKRTRKTPRLCATEHQEAVAYNHWRLAHIHQIPELENVLLNPLGGGRTAYKNKKGKYFSPAAIKLKQEGLEDSISDYFIAVARGGFHGFWMELKAMDGSPTRDQLAFLDRMRRYGYMAGWYRGWEAMAKATRDYLKLPKG